MNFRCYYLKNRYFLRNGAYIMLSKNAVKIIAVILAILMALSVFTGIIISFWG